MDTNSKVTIGIPAYNEENNIYHIVKSLLEQKEDTFVLENIVVISDASTDNTNKILESISDSRLKTTFNKNRQGKVVIMNDLFKTCKSDYLVIIDADTVINDSMFISKLVAPITGKKNIGIVGAKVESLRGDSLFERTIALSHKLKNDIYENNYKKAPLYLCHGRARLFSYMFYSTLQIPKDVPEDSYSYLACITRNLEFVYAPKAVVYFKSPSNLADHLKQSSRFKDGKTALLKYFSTNKTRKEFNIDISTVISMALITLFRHPILLVNFVFIYLYTLVFNKQDNVSHTTWNIALSSKKIT